MNEALRVSWSALKRWEGCHLRNQLTHEGNRAEVRDGRVFLPGTLADRAMRKFLEMQTGHQQGQMAEFVDQIWDEHAVNSTEYKIKWRGDPRVDQAKVRNFAKLVVNNLEPFLFEKVLPHEYWPELRFSVSIRLPDLDGLKHEVTLVGGIDIAVLELPGRDRAMLYDLKATENEAYIRSIMGQLIFYGIAWSILREQPHEQIGAAYLAPAMPIAYHPLEVTIDDRRDMLARIVRYCQAQWSSPRSERRSGAVDKEGEPVDPDKECWSCDVLHACPVRRGKVVTDDKGRHRASIYQSVLARQGRT
jgi:hypothetical protein